MGGWKSVENLVALLLGRLEERHAGLVTEINGHFEGDTLILSGQVASEDCRADAKRLALSFNGIFKVRNMIVVAGYLEAASDDDDYFMLGSQGADAFAPIGKEGGSLGSQTQGGGSTDVSGTTTKFTNGPKLSRPNFPVSSEAAEVIRTPEIEADRAIKASEEFGLTVSLTEAEVKGIAPVRIGTFPSGWDEIKVSVQLFAAWIIEITPITPFITLYSDGRSDPAQFLCRAAERLSGDEKETVQVSFMHGTRVCGHLSHDLPIDTQNDPEGQGDSQPLNDGPSIVEKGIAGQISISPDAVGPSLTVQVVVGKDGTQTWSWQAAVPGGIQHDMEEIFLHGGERKFAEDLLKECPGFSAEAHRRTMRGIGERLWGCAPSRFRTAYLFFRQHLPQKFPIQLVSDDAHIPWEIMKPDIPGIDHLFLEHPIARWPLTGGKFLRHTLPDGTLMSFVPQYEAHNSLPAALEEGEWLKTTFGAQSMKADSDTFFRVLECHYPEKISLIHFAGHGVVDAGIADGGIELEDRSIAVTEVNQSGVMLGDRDGTFIVLNACETSAGARILGMNSGWGNTIAARGFGGLLAPLWEVADDLATLMIQEALPPLIKGSATLGEAATKARQAHADRSISAFAYLAHGDVMARFPVRP